MKPRAPVWRRWLQAAAVWLILLFLGGLLQGFFLEPPLQERLCRWSPVTSTCQTLGLGRLPTEAMKRDFATAQAAQTRAALNRFRDIHKDSPLDAEALRALERCRPVAVPVSETIRHPMLVTQPLTAGDAEALAEEGARRLAAGLCGNLNGTTTRLVGVRIERAALECEGLGNRRLCTWKGAAACDIEEQRTVERCLPPQ